MVPKISEQLDLGLASAAPISTQWMFTSLSIAFTSLSDPMHSDMSEGQNIAFSPECYNSPWKTLHLDCWNFRCRIPDRNVEFPERDVQYWAFKKHAFREH